MAYEPMKPTKAGLEEPLEQIHKIRITLSSKNVKNLEKGLIFVASLLFWFSVRIDQLFSSAREFEGSGLFCLKVEI